ncbi:glycosyl transferase [Mesotoga sp. HF07.pep.5.2.highcov]|uniref:glycosyltransferase family 2 protein n=1 Tax=unclassified Mesotoga TaxID=1184398 RepID=UPI000FEFFF61|nr:glycosyltransferase family 2 protein [Mesotoga sp. HF07.pep.5.2.highcov]RLL89269.1 glycosyl transferase [Mesotoga sp. HF07.pep.5.2.highcov]
MEKPLVTIVIPARNEEKTIEKCLASLLQSDYPSSKLEIFVVDGMSEDQTRAIVERFSLAHSQVRLLLNEKKITPVARNIGVRASSGEYVMFFDAHSVAPVDYVRKCVELIEETGADNVGGVIKTVPSKETLLAEVISKVLSSSFGVGSSKFRTGVEKLVEVDTVPFGFYRKEVFEKIGLFNENLVRNQDIEFNLRLKRSGGKILLSPELEITYYSRSDLKGFLKNNFGNGFWVVFASRFSKTPFSARHLVPMIFTLFLLFGVFLPFFPPALTYFWLIPLLLYLTMDLIFSVRIMGQCSEKSSLLLAMVLFPLLHLAYGLGSIAGLLRLLFGGKR